jgi:hypothetical protein
MNKLLTFVIILLIFGVSLWAFTNPAPETETTAPPSAETEAAPKLPKLTVSFSETGFFYDSNIEVAITASISEAVIYYTTDGAEPTSESKRYEQPLTFTALKDTRAVVLKAFAVYEDTVTRPVAHTYFLGKDVASRVETMVFSISTNEEYLYDYDTGIFVAGRLRDEYIAENPKVHIDPPAPANFNIRGLEGERPVYVEAFTADGERVVAQAAGLRVSGGWSRAENQKSLRLIARNMYEPGVGKFRYAFFPDETTLDGYGVLLDKYDSILLRNGANDRDFGMLRDEVASKLARDAGFAAVSPYRAASVFLNGEYYGFAWLRAVINEQYLMDVYGAPTSDFEIAGDGDTWYKTDNMEVKRRLKT